jgi:hypothetical protein
MRIITATFEEVSVAVDAPDYVASMLFATLIVGDISDGIVTAILGGIISSKRSTLFSLVEFLFQLSASLYLPIAFRHSCGSIVNQSRSRSRQLSSKQRVLVLPNPPF